MRLSTLLACAAVALAVLSTSGKPAAAEDAPSWLFLWQGDVVSASEGALTLALPAKSVAFTDRPGREVALVDTQALASAWAPDGQFHADPPNASWVDETTGSIGVVEIGEAAWRDGRLTIGVTALEGGLPSAGARVSMTVDGLVVSGAFAAAAVLKFKAHRDNPS